jgi:glycosyltransferase involved in cell wall biosynthesis
MKLSILICSVHTRFNSFLPKIFNQLNDQVNQYNDVELLCLIDNKKMMLGEKRNKLVNMAVGEYVVFVDDDDVISDDYVSEIYKAIQYNADVICFDVNVSIDNSPYKPCYYSHKYDSDFNTDKAYHRLPNHIMAIKRNLCLETPYKNIPKGEDSAFSKDLKPKIKNEHQIHRALYYYNYSNATTESQQKIKR